MTIRIFPTETIIHHNFREETLAGDCDPARCAKHDVIYDFSLDEIIEMIDRSAECRQFIKVFSNIAKNYFL